MRTQMLFLVIITLVLTSACQKQEFTKIDDTWKKIDVTLNPGETSNEVWEMANGNLTIKVVDKDGQFVNHIGGTYQINNSIGSRMLTISNSPLKKYNGDWNILELKSNYFIISRAEGEFTYLEFEQFTN